MKFLADESVDDPIVERLRSKGYDLDYIKELSPGIDDESVLLLALEGNRILITMDKDFGELVYRRRQKHAGVVLLRLDGYKPTERAEIVVNIFEKHVNELINSFTVIQANFTRIRPM